MEQRMQRKDRSGGKDMSIWIPRDNGRTFQDWKGTALQPLERIETDGNGRLAHHGFYCPGGTVLSDNGLKGLNELLR